MVEFGGLVVLLVAIGLGLYVYADRYSGIDEAERSTR